MKIFLPLVFILLSNSFSGKGCFSRIYYTAVQIPIEQGISQCDHNPAFIDAALKEPVKPNYHYAYLDEAFIKNSRTENIDAWHPNTFNTIKTNCNISFQKSSLTVSGWHLVILDKVFIAMNSINYSGKSYSIAKDGLIATLSEETVFPLKQEKAMYLGSLLESFSPGNPSLPVNNIQMTSVPPRFSFSANGNLNPIYTSFSNRNTETRENLKATLDNVLTQNGWQNFKTGFIKKDGKFYPSAVVQFGEQKTVFAPYGKFTNAKLAARFGYTPKDKLYYSAQKITSDPDSLPQFKQLLTPEMRFGDEIYLESDLHNRMEEIEQDIPWQEECRNSVDDDFVSDDFNHPLLSLNNRPNESGFLTPIAPDDYMNSNELAHRECPDKYFYWSLYVKCIKEIYGDNFEVPNSREYVSFEDYLNSAMNENESFAAMHADGTPYESDIDREIFPETPAYYNKKGERLNPTSKNLVYNPTDKRVTYYGKDEVWGCTNRTGGVCTWWGWIPKERDITKFMQPRIEDAFSFFEGYVKKGKRGVLSFFSLNEDYYEKDLTFNNTHGNLNISMKIDSKEYFKNDWMFLNPTDKYLEYKSPTIFIVSSETGVPYKFENRLRNRDFLEKGFEDKTKFQNWFVVWKYSIYSKDKYGDVFSIGELYIESLVYQNEIDGPSISPEHMSGQVLTKGPKSALLPGYDKYDLEGRNARTDLKSLNERDDLTFDQKIDAISNIALNIAVSEGLDMAMKFIHKNYPYWYVLAKKSENWTAIMVAAKIAYMAHKGYKEWRLMMDILSEVRDTYSDLHKSAGRLKKTSRLLINHFTTLEYSKIRPTNITMIYPKRAVKYFDYSVNNLNNSLVNFEFAMHALAFNIDRFTHGPGKLGLAYLQKSLWSNEARVLVENDLRREKNHEELLESYQSAQNNQTSSDHLRLSKYTKISIDKTKALQITSLSSSTAGLEAVLLATQQESNDWILMRDYVTQNIAGGPGAFSESKKKRSPRPIYDQFNVSRPFQNKWVDKKVAEMEAKK